MPLPATIPDVIGEAARRWPTHEAVIDGERRISFADLADLISRAAGLFVERDIAPGDRVAIWAPNSLEWIVACAGAQAAGAAIVPINSRLKGAEAAHVLDATRAVALVTVAEFAGNDYLAMLAGHPLPHLQHRLLLGETWRAQIAATVPFASIADPSGIADIIFTSGTTGLSKGVVATHRQDVMTADSWATPVGLREGDRYLLVNPFFHSFGYKAGWLPCFLRGATAVSVPSFDAATLPALIEAERITVLAGAPTIFQSLLDTPGAPARVGSLRTAVTGAASVPPVLIERMRAELSIPTVLTGYGLTEATGVVTMSDAADSADVAALTAGRPVPGIEVVCVDADGAPVSPGEEGEVRVRGYNVMAGYWENPTATAEAVVDGWLRTGDIGRFTPQGCLQITDRLKDMYISGGFNCYPAEIERLLATHHAVAQVAVVGMPDDRMGEVGRAFVVLRPGSSLVAADLMAWARGAMANYKAPRAVEIVPALPLNASGKVLKFVLRERAMAALAREGTTA